MERGDVMREKRGGESRREEEGEQSGITDGIVERKGEREGSVYTLARLLVSNCDEERPCGVARERARELAHLRAC